MSREARREAAARERLERADARRAAARRIAAEARETDRKEQSAFRAERAADPNRPRLDREEPDD